MALTADEREIGQDRRDSTQDMRDRTQDMRDRTQDLTEHDLLIRIDERVGRLTECLDDHGTRLKVVEDNQLKVLGIGTITGFIAGYLSKYINGGS